MASEPPVCEESTLNQTGRTDAYILLMGKRQYLQLIKKKKIRKELWKAIFAHNSFYFYMTPPTPIGYNQNCTTGFQKSLI